MSWDILVVNFCQKYKSVNEIPYKESPLPLGPMDFVHKAVLEHFSDTNWKDSTWGIFNSDFGSIEFNIGEEDPTQSMMLHVRASNEIITPIIKLCNSNAWSAIDYSSGEFLENSEDPASGLESWQSYSQHVLNSINKTPHN